MKHTKDRQKVYNVAQIQFFDRGRRHYTLKTININDVPKS